MEIQRLIARALPRGSRFKTLVSSPLRWTAMLSGRCCTRTPASITRAHALRWRDALNKLVVRAVNWKTNPMKGMVATVSVGIVNGEAVCDLEYVEDSAAETDMNVVMTEQAHH